MFGSEGASDYLRGAAGQHGDPAQDGERKGVCSCRLMKQEQFIVTEMAQNVALTVGQTGVLEECPDLC